MPAEDKHPQRHGLALSPLLALKKLCISPRIEGNLLELLSPSGRKSDIDFSLATDGEIR
jgi:hypothetical protein